MYSLLDVKVDTMYEKRHSLVPLWINIGIFNVGRRQLNGN